MINIANPIRCRLSHGLEVRIYERFGYNPSILLASDEGIIELSPDQAAELVELISPYYQGALTYK